MERLWNLLHFVIFNFIAKLYLFFMQVDPILNLAYKTKFAKSHFERKGYDPKEVLLNTLNNPSYGVSSWYSYIILNLLFMPSGLLLIYIYELIFGVPETGTPYIFILLFLAAIITLISYIFLLRNNKYVAYIRLFNKQSRRWKTCWSVICAFILLLPSIITVLGLKYLP